MREKRYLYLLGTVLFIIGFASLLTSSLADETEWGYSGETGPEYWGELAPEFALCESGRAQSPIDIREPGEINLVDIEFNYGESENMIVNNGHTIQVNVGAGSFIVYNGISYDLLQFHFHTPSEHTIEGEAAAMEIHFVHQDANSGMLAVVGALLEEGDADNEAYAGVMDNMPDEVDKPQALGAALALETLLPETRAYYTYQGSLTTPPCSEIARWLLLERPVQLSRAQISAFAELYPHNARPTLPLGARDLLLDSR